MGRRSKGGGRVIGAVAIVRVEGSASGVHRLADGRELALALTVRLETPGEACVAIVAAVLIGYAPSLSEEVAVRLDDRLYDGLYAGLAVAEGALPPGRLRIGVVAVQSEPALTGALLPSGDWVAVGALGETLAALAAEATVRAWGALVEAMG